MSAFVDWGINRIEEDVVIGLPSRGYRIPKVFKGLFTQSVRVS